MIKKKTCKGKENIKMQSKFAMLALENEQARTEWVGWRIPETWEY